MDISIAGPSTTTTTHSSHSPVKRSRAQHDGGPKKQPKRRKKGKDGRFDSDDFSRDADPFGDDAYNNRLSSDTRDTVLKLKRIKDPFDPDLQEVVDSVFVHFDQQPCDNVDLAESALLLSSVTHVYSTQVKTLHEEVLAMAARLTGRENPQKGRRKKNAENNGEKEATNAEDNSQIAAGEEAKDDTQEKDKEKNAETEEGVGEGCTSGESTNPEGDANGANSPALPADGDPTANGDNNETTTASKEGEGEAVKDENKDSQPEGAAGEPTVEELEKLESEILSEIPARCTRRQSERLKNILNIEKANDRDYKLKKKKFDDDPPTLISCDEEWNEIVKSIEDHGDVDWDAILPPVLEVQVGRRKKKVTINNNEINADDDNNCEACHQAGSDSDIVAGDSGNAEVPSPFKLPLQVDVNGQKYETLDHLPDDVQERFHALIQEMHKLPFDYGLMQQDMFKAYQQKFLQAVSLLSQNSVLVKRTDKDDQCPPPPPTADIDLNDSQLSETDQTISSISELLNQVRHQAAEDYNKGRQSKSDAEIPISQMIATLKRIICSRYKKWHVRTDSDKAVFTRIKDFEDRVKAVLRREAEQGLFDVKKYEMEVMDVTLKESQDGETDEFGCPMSPMLSLPESADSPSSEEAKNWSLMSLSRRSSIAGSIDGSSSWIRLYDIFSHMKKIDNSETCRHFYAVLALLSHQNLAINYDTLFSQESAKLITKLLKKHHHNGINVDKYPVGAKIMNSRCPDVDRDEILLTPVFSAAFRQALEQDGYLSSSGYQSDSQASSSGTSLNFAQPKSIQDAISEFVLDPGEPLTEDLFMPKRRKKQ